jgi:hypothetical protein
MRQKYQRRTRAQWQQNIEQFQTSGQSGAAFCKVQAISYASFCQRKQTLSSALSAEPSSDNWLFCWTELGAEHVGLIQSLISECKLHDIHPCMYLIDVLQRISIHPASKVGELAPRVWKETFADNPLRSVLHKEFKYVAE